MKKFFVLIALLMCTNAYAYDISDYFPFDDGASSVLDRDVFILDGTEYTFGTDTGKRFIQGRVFNDDGFAYLTDRDAGITWTGYHVPSSDTYINLSGYNIIFFPSHLNINESVSCTVPSGVLFTNQFQMTSTYLGKESVTIDSTTYSDCVKIRLDMQDTGSGTYREIVWLAKNKGIVKIHRESESNSYNGCIFTCGCYNSDYSSIDTRTLNGTAQNSGEKKVAVIPLF